MSRPCFESELGVLTDREQTLAAGQTEFRPASPTSQRGTSLSFSICLGEMCQ